MGNWWRRVIGLQRDEHGWKIKKRFWTIHPVSYGTGTLGRISIGVHPEGRRLMLHYFPAQEYAAHYHDHPWSFWTVVLKGCYIDESFNPDGTLHHERMKAGTVRRRAALHRHRTKNNVPTITLVFRNATERTWCEGDTSDWKCEGAPADFNETLGYIPRVR